MSVEDRDSFEPLDEGYRLPHSLDVQAMKINVLSQCYCHEFFLAYKVCLVLKYGTGDSGRADLNKNCRVDIDTVFPKWVQVVTTSIQTEHT